MRGNALPKVILLLLVVFVALTFRYWQASPKRITAVNGIVRDWQASPKRITAVNGIVRDKLERPASSGGEDIYIVRIRTTKGPEIDIEVPYEFYRRVEIGNTISRSSPYDTPVIVSR